MAETGAEGRIRVMRLEAASHFVSTLLGVRSSFDEQERRVVREGAVSRVLQHASHDVIQRFGGAASR